jgi:hypothetical protein
MFHNYCGDAIINHNVVSLVNTTEEKSHQAPDGEIAEFIFKKFGVFVLLTKLPMLVLEVLLDVNFSIFLQRLGPME